ncbi:MAG: hydroxyacid dehydrogenase [Nitrospiraceae bacterium]|nr:hydroxyacid dehydrogenase [Nitrospiraceae bacterium]
MTKKIVFVKVGGWEKEYVKSRFESDLGNLSQEYELKFVNKCDDIDNDCEILSVFVDTTIKRELINQLNNLKFVALMSTGYNNVDLNACKERGIIVSNVPNYGEHTVAEYAFSLILSLSRNLRKTYNLDYFNKELVSLKETNEFTGFDLFGKTIGVIGTGRIGRHVIEIARGFSMNVIAYDRFPNKEESKRLNYEYVSLEDLLKKSDIITIHVPLFKETFHLINESNINLIKKGAVLINTSRGEIIDTKSVLKAVSESRLYKVGLDVIEYENLLRKNIKDIKDLSDDESKGLLYDYKLINLPNVIYTPHIAFNTKEAIMRILNATVDNIKSYFNGDAKNKVNDK